jgi:hypothetical protein
MRRNLGISVPLIDRLGLPRVKRSYTFLRWQQSQLAYLLHGTAPSPFPDDGDARALREVMNEFYRPASAWSCADPRPSHAPERLSALLAALGAFHGCSPDCHYHGRRDRPKHGGDQAGLQNEGRRRLMLP